VEFAKSDGSPDADRVKRIQQQAQQAGLLLLSCGVYGNVIRLLYPLTIPDTVFDEALAKLADAMHA
jgi:4-aminobutyrate aminotransferase